MLTGRRDETEVLDRLVDAAQNGQSRARVVHGDPGVAKTALLHHLEERTNRVGCRLLQVVGMRLTRYRRVQSSSVRARASSLADVGTMPPTKAGS